jgi:hypothetical protein
MNATSEDKILSAEKGLSIACTRTSLICHVGVLLVYYCLSITTAVTAAVNSRC